MASAMQRRGACSALLVAAVLASCSLETEGLWLPSETGGSGGQAGWSGAAGALFGGSSGGGVPSDASNTGGVAGADASGGAAGADGGGGAAGESPGIHCANYPGSTELVVNGATHCYWLGGTLAAQADAMAVCGEKGGYLATLVLQAEHDLVATLAQTQTVWLGLSRPPAAICTKADYKWMTGEVAVFDGWDTIDPDCSGTGVAMVETGRWRDRDAASLYGYACEAGPLLQ